MATKLLTLILKTCAVFYYNSWVWCKHTVSAVLTSKITFLHNISTDC